MTLVSYCEIILNTFRKHKICQSSVICHECKSVCYQCIVCSETFHYFCLFSSTTLKKDKKEPRNPVQILWLGFRLLSMKRTKETSQPRSVESQTNRKIKEKKKNRQKVDFCCSPSNYSSVKKSHCNEHRSGKAVKHVFWS